LTVSAIRDANNVMYIRLWALVLSGRRFVRYFLRQ
jgi:hypothetical protein